MNIKSTKEIYQTNRDIGRKIRDLRIAREMSQDNLGQRLGISGRQVRHYETGSSSLLLVKAGAMAKIFEVHLEFFVAGIQFE